MMPLLFVLSLAVFMGITLAWGYRTLPAEKWQMVAALPQSKCDDGHWKGLNLTWYGLLSANAYVFGVGLLLILAGAAGIGILPLVAITLAFLSITIPASKIIAGLVEKKQATLTVGGAVFAGAVTAPWLMVLVNNTLGKVLGFSIPVPVMLAAISIGYTFGEALGRLACISFGCCYGKPLARCSVMTQWLFARFNLVFFGKTKKISYAAGLNGEKMIPIQIITAIIYTVSGLVGIYLFLKGEFGLAFMETIWVTQTWRVVSEFFRADFRGGMRFSMYQIMALATMIYSSIVILLFPETKLLPNITQGLESLWHPGILLFLQFVWLASFLHCGISSVTDSRIVFDVVKEKI